MRSDTQPEGHHKGDTLARGTIFSPSGDSLRTPSCWLSPSPEAAQLDPTYPCGLTDPVHPPPPPPLQSGVDEIREAYRRKLEANMRDIADMSRAVAIMQVCVLGGGACMTLGRPHSTPHSPSSTAYYPYHEPPCPAPPLRNQDDSSTGLKDPPPHSLPPSPKPG